MRNQIYYATWLRVLAMAFIIIGHCVGFHPNTMMRSSFQFFNVANEIFFMLSGFLLGVKGIRTSYTVWMRHRFKRIYVPYVLFVVIVGIFALLNGTDIWHWRWLHLLMGIQGTYVGIDEAPHTWFVSAILLCYLFTPLLDKITIRVKKSSRLSVLYCLLLFSLPLLFAYVEDACPWMMGTAVGCYGLAYFWGNENGVSERNKNIFILALVFMIVSILVRLIGKHYYDDTVFYDRILSMYSHIILALCISYVMKYLFYNIKPTSIIVYLSNISFEVYLYHYIFLVGFLAVYVHVESWWLGTFVVFVMTFLLAGGMHKVAGFFTERCSR